MKRIIMFTGGNETQEYFSLQLAKVFKKAGYKLFLFQLNKGYKNISALCDFIEKNNTIVITFNFHGLDGKEPFDNSTSNFWNDMELPCYNIVLDHPFYYHKLLASVPEHYIHISIDHGHERYMKRFFPEIKLGPFLPLAGTEIPHKPFDMRSKDIVFTGNYTPPWKFDKFITRINDDYTAFYHDIIDDLIAHPEMEMDVAFEKHLIQEMNDLSDNDLKACMEKMTFIDLYVRFYFRGLVIKTLVDNGFPVYIYGAGWELLDCRHPENIIFGKQVRSLECLQALADGKISLNVMPWFKQGGHDRIFNSILNGALCLSDDNIWLRENLKDNKEIVYYSLSEIDKLPSMVDELLSNPSHTEQIIQNGYRKVKTLHTWKNRAEILEEVIQGS